jgi:hypothetical protein
MTDGSVFEDAHYLIKCHTCMQTVEKMTVTKRLHLESVQAPGIVLVFFQEFWPQQDAPCHMLNPTGATPRRLGTQAKMMAMRTRSSRRDLNKSGFARSKDPMKDINLDDG